MRAMLAEFAGVHNEYILQWCRNRGGQGGHWPPQYFADHLTLFEPGRADYLHLLLLAPPPMFFTFRHHCFWKLHDPFQFFSSHRDGSMTLDLSQVPGCNGDGTQDCVLDLFVENIGRTNYGKPHQFDQKKGLWEGPVSIDGDVIKDWEIIPLEFKGDWVRR